MTVGPGRIILINGTSSSGKTTLVKGLQSTLPELWLEMGIDRFAYALPGRVLGRPTWPQLFRYVRPAGRSDGLFRIETTPLGQRFISGMHATAAALAGAGLNVIVDHVLLERPGSTNALDSGRVFQCFSSACAARLTLSSGESSNERIGRSAKRRRNSPSFIAGASTTSRSTPPFSPRTTPWRGSRARSRRHGPPMPGGVITAALDGIRGGDPGRASDQINRPTAARREATIQRLIGEGELPDRAERLVAQWSSMRPGMASSAAGGGCSPSGGSGRRPVKDRT